jgi:hypothetical protein
MQVMSVLDIRRDSESDNRGAKKEIARVVRCVSGNGRAGSRDLHGNKPCPGIRHNFSGKTGLH